MLMIMLAGFFTCLIVLLLSGLVYKFIYDEAGMLMAIFSSILAMGFGAYALGIFIHNLLTG